MEILGSEWRTHEVENRILSSASDPPRRRAADGYNGSEPYYPSLHRSIHGQKDWNFNGRR